MELCNRVKTHFQGLELQVQKAMRLKAQIRTENIGLKRSHLELREEAEEELRPTKQARQEAMVSPPALGGPVAANQPGSNRALQVLQSRARVAQ